jgi:alanine racemase
VTFGIPGRARSGAVREARTAPLARLSRTALELNLRAVLSSSPGGVVDVRADGWGHGVTFVARTALQEGARMLLVDDAGAAELADTVDRAHLAFAGDANAPEAVYGLTPGFTPVLSLVGTVLSLKLLRAGEGVSYGYTHRAESDTTVALVTGGYAQGVVRALGNAVSVQQAQRRHPIIGRVAMDVCVIDVGEDGEVQRGDEVVFFGDPGAGAPGIAAWTSATGLQAAELVAAVGLRNDREYVG